jgi:hypothetical protein
MKNRLNKMVLATTTLLLLTVLAVGPAVPSADVPVAEPTGAVEAWDGLHGLLACPAAGGGSGA